MNYEEWESAVPAEIKGDSLWKMEAYRLGLFAADVGWRDVTKLVSLLTQVIRLLLAMIPQQRGRVLHEQIFSYQIGEEKSEPAVDRETLAALLRHIPLP